jgi:DNA-binding IclR family transcriptional regulator
VSFDPAVKTYKIGQGVADLARGASIFGRNVDVIQGLLERIARDHDVAVTLWRPVSEDRMLLILAAFAAGQTRIHMSVGEHLPLLIGSAGRIMAAFQGLSPRELRRQRRLKARGSAGGASTMATTSRESPQSPCRYLTTIYDSSWRARRQPFRRS